MQFRYIAVEGPIGAGKTTLAERLARVSTRRSCSRKPKILFSPTSTRDRPGAALQAQLFYLLNRHRQQTALQQADLFSQITVSDYLFDKDKIFAYLNLDDNELFIYQRLYDLLARDVPRPDLVIYLQAPTEVLLRRLRNRAQRSGGRRIRTRRGISRELNEAYHHFFFHYDATPLLVVETSQFDSDVSDEALDDLVKQIGADGRGHAVLRSADEVSDKLGALWRGSRRPASRSPRVETRRAGSRRASGSSVPAARRSSTTRISPRI